jgi:hypothetical protein
MTAQVPTGDRELFGLLDAYLDDELPAAERESVDALLERSPTARAELADIDRVRSMVRGLPSVDVPPDFYQRLARPDAAVVPIRRRRRVPGLVFASAGAVAASILLFVAVTPSFDRFAPPIDDLEARHAAMAASTSERYEPSMSEDQVTDTLNRESPSGEYRRVETIAGPDDVQMLYSDGRSAISVFEHDGEVDWEDLPDAGAMMTIDQDPAWVMVMPASEIVVVERDGIVVTVIGTASHDDVMITAECVPDAPPPSFAERVGDACEWIARGFGFPS